MLNVFDWIRSRTPHGRKASELYGSIVALARAPTLYAAAGVPDTPAGRYEMVVLHTAFALQALKRQAAKQTELAGLDRGVVERFVTDMDDSMRQLAVGDMSVPRKVKKAAAGLRERVEAYAAACANPEPVAALATYLESTVWPDGVPVGADVNGLARYARAGLGDAAIADGRLTGLPAADAIFAAGTSGSSAE